MVYPTVTELMRGSAHLESQRSHAAPVALSAGLEPLVATTGRMSAGRARRGDFLRRPDAPLRPARRDEVLGAFRRTMAPSTSARPA
jgi:hypothetical protein